MVDNGPDCTPSSYPVHATASFAARAALGKKHPERHLNTLFTTNTLWNIVYTTTTPCNTWMRADRPPCTPPQAQPEVRRRVAELLQPRRHPGVLREPEEPALPGPLDLRTI